MRDFIVDIVVPVWNAPVVTRNCLVSLIEHAPSARLVLVDNGSERETERMLQEFAEGLAERALLIRNELNHGFVKAVNQGLERTEAPFLAVVRNTSVVTDGWLEPMIETAGLRPEAGIFVPRLTMGNVVTGRRPKKAGIAVSETGSGSFAAVMLRRKLFELIGGFDDELDGGVWCLKDYSRRAYRAGFLTFAAQGAPVSCAEPVALGSQRRREETLRISAETYTQRWGAECSYCVHFPKETDPQVFLRKLDILLAGARQGHAFTLLVPARLSRVLHKQGLASPHTGIVIEPMPLFGGASAVAKAFQRVLTETPDCRAVTGIDGIPFPGVVDASDFNSLEQEFRQAETEIFGH